jgi:hypothetical protein
VEPHLQGSESSINSKTIFTFAFSQANQKLII